MLSDRIQALADRFTPYVGDGMELDPIAVALIAEALKDCAADAREIERVRVVHAVQVAQPERRRREAGDLEIPAYLRRQAPGQPRPRGLR